MTIQIHKKTILFIFLTMIIGMVNASNVFFEVSGWVKKDDKTVRKASVRIYEGDELKQEKNTNIWGNFYFLLEADKNYTVVIEEENSAPKTIVFNTHMGVISSEGKEYFFEFVVDLFERNEYKESIFLHHLVIFDQDIDNFLYHKPIVSEHLMIDSPEEMAQEFEGLPLIRSKKL